MPAPKTAAAANMFIFRILHPLEDRFRSPNTAHLGRVRKPAKPTQATAHIQPRATTGPARCCAQPYFVVEIARVTTGRDRSARGSHRAPPDGIAPGCLPYAPRHFPTQVVAGTALSPGP